MRKDMEEDDGGEEDEGGEEAEEEEEDWERARARERGRGTGSCESRGVELPYLVLAFLLCPTFSVAWRTQVAKQCPDTDSQRLQGTR